MAHFYRAIGSFMTGVELTKGKVHVGMSIDQLAAQHGLQRTRRVAMPVGTLLRRCQLASYWSATRFVPSPA